MSRSSQRRPLRLCMLAAWVFGVATTAAGALGTPERIQGSETCVNPPVLDVTALPLQVQGTTVGYVNDIDEQCPDEGSHDGAPDVFYQFTTPDDMALQISTCVGNTDFDTSLFLYSADCTTLIACDEDECDNPPHFPDPYAARIEYVALSAGETYVLMIDGWDTDSAGDYTLEILGLPLLPACPSDTLGLSQRSFAGSEPWAVHAATTSHLVPLAARRYEHFVGVGGPIERVRWWGISRIHDEGGNLIPCPLNPGTFEVRFYERRLWPPLPRQPNLDLEAYCSYNTSVEGILTKTAEGSAFYGPYRLWKWDYELPVPCELSEGWVVLQNADLCAFWWAGSPDGDAAHYMTVTDAPTQDDLMGVDGDLSYCLAGPSTGITGACCDLDQGCTNGYAPMDCVGTYQFFFPGLTCSELPDPYGGCDPWQFAAHACCIDGECVADLEPFGCELIGGVPFPFHSCLDPLFVCPGGDPCAPYLRADANVDGLINAADIGPFALGVVDLAAWQALYPDVPATCVLDVNCDGLINAGDIDPFVQCLVNGQCAPCP